MRLGVHLTTLHSQRLCTVGVSISVLSEWVNDSIHMMQGYPTFPIYWKWNKLLLRKHLDGSVNTSVPWEVIALNLKRAEPLKNILFNRSSQMRA